MQATEATHFKHKLAFTRRTKREGLLSLPIAVFVLSDERGAEIGTLAIKSNNLSFTTPAGREDFSLKRNFWSRRWMLAGENAQEFGQMRIGFPYSFSFANGERFTIKVRRRRFTGTPSADNPSLQAIFSRSGAPVMILKNTGSIGFFSNDAFASLDGIIGTDISDNRSIAGLLLFFQSYLTARNHSV